MSTHLASAFLIRKEHKQKETHKPASIDPYAVLKTHVGFPTYAPIILPPDLSIQRGHIRPRMTNFNETSMSIHQSRVRAGIHAINEITDDGA